MNKDFRFNFEDETIVCSKKALRAASNPTSTEYKTLMKMKKLQPTFKVVAREIETNENKNSYKGLTLDLIQSYIETTNTKETLMAEFNEHKANGGYPLVKKWWCENFKHITVAQMKKTLDNRSRAKIKTKAYPVAISNKTEQKKAVGQNQN